MTADNNEQVATQKIDDYKKYWNQVVVPDYDDFFQNLDNLRKAFHCASSLFHMADWLYWDNKAYIDANLTWLDGSVRKPVVDEKTFANAIRDLDPKVRADQKHRQCGKASEYQEGQAHGLAY